MDTFQYLPYLIQAMSTIIISSFILGRYKATSDNYEKIFDRHEKSLEAILDRLEFINNEVHFIKGYVFSKDNENNSADNARIMPKV